MKEKEIRNFVIEKKEESECGRLGFLETIVVRDHHCTNSPNSVDFWVGLVGFYEFDEMELVTFN